MIDKLNCNNQELLNEIVSFIFIKQSLQKYYLNTFPKKIEEIKKEIKHCLVLYLKNNAFNIIIVIENDIIKYFYALSLDDLKQSLPYIKGKKILITNKEHFLLNIDDIQLKSIKINKTIYHNIQIKHNSNYIFNKNSDYLINSLQSHLLDEYYEIHQGKIESNVKTLVCIKNNEMIGYLDYIDDKIINIGYINNINKQVFLLTIIEYYLHLYNYKQVNYYCDDGQLNEFQLVNYNMVETINIFEF